MCAGNDICVNSGHQYAIFLFRLPTSSLALLQCTPGTLIVAKKIRVRPLPRGCYPTPLSYRGKTGSSAVFWPPGSEVGLGSSDSGAGFEVGFEVGAACCFALEVGCGVGCEAGCEVGSVPTPFGHISGQGGCMQLSYLGFPSIWTSPTP